MRTYGSALKGLNAVTEDLEAVVEDSIGSRIEVGATGGLEEVGVAGGESLRGRGGETRTPIGL